MNPQNQRDIVYLNLFGHIDQQKVTTAMKACTEVINLHAPKTIYFSFASNGGEVAAGIALYTFIKGLPVEKVVMHSIGSIDSIANIIFLAGEERYGDKNSRFLFHGVVVNVSVASQLNLVSLRETVSGIESDQNRISTIIVENTKLKNTEVSKMFEQGQATDISFAIQNGIVHEERSFSVPQGEVVYSI